jgi:hypothetical protein
MRENNSTYYVRWLVVVAIAIEIFDLGDFFDMIPILLNVVGSSCKERERLVQEQS